MINRLFIRYLCLVFSIPLGAFAQHTNVMISDVNFPNEPSIAINPKNTNELVAGSNIDNYYYSFDSGVSWNQGILSSSFGVWGDPAIACDTSENFYFFHLSNPPTGNWIDRIVCQRAASPGAAWNNGSFTGLNGTKAQDKQWVAINRTNNSIYMTWTEFDEYGSFNPSDSSRILFSSSSDQGLSWTTPLKINEISGDCVDSDNTVEGAVPCIGPNGEIYVSWAGPAELVFDRSINGGVTWLTQDIPVTSIPGGWDFSIPDILRANGLPVTTCDTSNGPHHGTIYINWSDQRNGSTDTDVWLVKSTDGGNTWSLPVMVNDDSSQRHQFFTWMTIDQTNGTLWFVFYDRRNYTDSRTDVYMARSVDGGNTFQNFKISDSPFIPDAGVFFGDYTNVTAYNNVVRPIWTRLHNTQLSVWTALVDVTWLSSHTEDPIQLLEQNYPNPFAEVTSISFKLHQEELISLGVYDLSGRQVTELIHEQSFTPGKHVETFRLNLPPGTYIYELRTQTGVLKRKMISLR